MIIELNTQQKKYLLNCLKNNKLDTKEFEKIFEYQDKNFTIEVINTKEELQAIEKFKNDFPLDTREKKILLNV